MSYNICHIDVYIFDYNCDKIKTKITVLIKGFVHLNPFLPRDLKNVYACVCKLLSLIYTQYKYQKCSNHI